MNDMISFVSWFFSNLPTFLFTAPVSYFIGLGLCAFIINLILSIKRR